MPYSLLLNSRAKGWDGRLDGSWTVTVPFFTLVGSGFFVESRCTFPLGRLVVHERVEGRCSPLFGV